MTASWIYSSLQPWLEKQTERLNLVLLECGGKSWYGRQLSLPVAKDARAWSGRSCLRVVDSQPFKVRIPLGREEEVERRGE